jgi:zinc transporter ZupT
VTFATVLWLTSLPAIGNTVGTVIAEWMQVTERRLSLALHASAGVLLAVVAVELIPEALQKTPPWLVTTSFVAGGLLFILLDHSLEISVRGRARAEVRRVLGRFIRLLQSTYSATESWSESQAYYRHIWASFHAPSQSAGLLATLAVEEVIPQAHEREGESHAAAAMFVLGFASFIALSSYL